MNALGARVRLVKGAYQEPRSVAYQAKADVDAAFVEIMQLLLDRGDLSGDRDARSGDDRRDAGVRARARTSAPDRYEFQMLYGIRRDLQAQLVGAGLRVRVYVPFGREWFPYFMRRLGERPANIGFVVRSLLRERYRLKSRQQPTAVAPPEPRPV